MPKFTTVKPAKGTRDDFNRRLQLNQHTGQKVGSVLVSVGYKNFEGGKLRALLAFASQSFDVCYILANSGLQAYGKAAIDGDNFPLVYDKEVAKGKQWTERCYAEVERLAYRLSIINHVYSGKELYSAGERQQFRHQCRFVVIRWEKWEAQERFKQHEKIVKWIYQNPNKLLELSEGFKQRADVCEKKENLRKIAKILSLAAGFKAAHAQSSEEYARRQGKLTFSEAYLIKESAAMSLWPRCPMLYVGSPTAVLGLTENLCNAGFFEMVSLLNGQLLINEDFHSSRENRQNLRWTSLKFHDKEIADPRFVLDNFYHSQIKTSYQDAAFTNFPDEAFQHANRYIHVSSEKYYFEVENALSIERKNLAALTKEEQQALLEQTCPSLDTKSESVSPAIKEMPKRPRSFSCPNLPSMMVFANKAHQAHFGENFTQNETKEGGRACS